MLPDLRAHRIERFSLRVTIDIPERNEILQQLRSLGGESLGMDEETVGFHSRYKASRRIHHVWLTASQSAPHRMLLSSYGWTGDARSGAGKGFAEVTTALKWLGEQKVSGVAHFHVSYNLPRRLFTPILALPMQILRIESLPFDRVLGVRLGKLGEGDEVRSLIIDYVGNSLRLALSFESDTGVDETVLQRMVSSSRDLVVPVLVRSKEVEEWQKVP